MYEDNNYLAHYGVKGMKWGVRRASNTVVGEKKAAYKQAKKEYNKSYSKAYKYSSRHPVGQWASKKKSAEADRRWEDAIDKAGKLNTAKSEYKQAKKDAKASRKNSDNKVAIGLKNIASKKLNEIDKQKVERRKKLMDDLLFPNKSHENHNWTERPNTDPDSQPWNERPSRKPKGNI